MNRPIITTLVGSSRFPDAFHLVNAHLSLQGRVVLSIAGFGHADYPTGFSFLTSDADEETNENKLLFDLQCRKIDMSDGIFVINVGGYIGSTTKREIEYALSYSKTIEYLFERRDRLSKVREAKS